MCKFIKNLMIVTLLFIGCCVLPLMFSGCATNKAINKSNIDMPEWYMIEQTSKDGIYAVGSANMPDTRIGLRMAKADAINNASKRISVIVKDVTQTMISGSKTDSMVGFEENALQTSIATLSDVRRTALYIAKDGTAYVQIFVPYATRVDELNKLAKEKYHLADEYLATQEKMENAYNKYFSNN